MLIKRLSLFCYLALFWMGYAEAVTLSFKPIQRNEDRTVIDLGLPGPSLGDGVLGHGIINDLQGKAIGNFEFISFVTDKRAESDIRWLQAQYAFGEDSILIEGAQEFMADDGKPVLNLPSSYSVTGGTGKYNGARGACRVIRVNESDFHITCKFNTIKMKF